MMQVLVGSKTNTRDHDALEAKRTRRSIMNSQRKCPSCSSTNLEPGTIQSTGRIHFRPENTNFFTLSTNEVAIVSNVCLDCGNVMLVADTRKAAKLLDKARVH